MELNGRRVLVCNCEASMALDGRALADALGVDGPAPVHTQLCRAQIQAFRDAAGSAAADGAGMLVACTQEAPLFGEVLGEMEADVDALFTNIRERAGWSDQSVEAQPKIAALLRAAAVPVAATPLVPLRSEGTCLVYGRDETAIEVARQLSSRLDVTVLLTGPGEVIPPRIMDVPVFKGTVAAAAGHFGAFEIVVDDYAPTIVSSRAALGFLPAKDGAASTCDLILDLTGGTPLFPSHERRDGYLRPDPGDPAAVQRAVFEISGLVGEFEKPRYVTFHADLCAHSRNTRTGCTRCLEVCPASAIQPAGDTVAIDPYLCGGCGACHSVCPTGAAEYAYPPPSSLLERVRTLLATYHAVGGRTPVLLVHDEDHGEDMVALGARYGRGLPAHVLPLAVHQTTQVGFDLLAAALAYGAAGIVLLEKPARAGETTGLARQIAYAEAVLAGLGYGADRVRLLVEDDPEALETALWQGPLAAGAAPGSFLAFGSKRDTLRLALMHLHGAAPAPVDTLPMPAGAPFGRLEIDAAGCTLCLACVGACPTGALLDNPDHPQLRFTESACVQCGLCVDTCPERVIALDPRITFTPDAMTPVTVKEEDPFACVRCGKLFGTKSSVERIVAKLAEKHWMFQDSAQIERIKMCEDCRVVAQFDSGDAPMAGAPRPMPRTTDDDLRERDAARGPDTPKPH